MGSLFINMSKVQVNERYVVALSPQYEKDLELLKQAFKNPKTVENWKTWSADLKSGKYTQCRSRLKTDTNLGFNYCCLGVACNIAAAQGVGTWNDLAFGADNKSASTGVIPTHISNQIFGAALDNSWFKISSASTESADTSFQGLNDYFGFTFEDIAKVVDMIIETMSPDEERQSNNVVA